MCLQCTFGTLKCAIFACKLHRFWGSLYCMQVDGLVGQFGRGFRSGKARFSVGGSQCIEVGGGAYVCSRDGTSVLVGGLFGGLTD